MLTQDLAIDKKVQYKIDSRVGRVENIRAQYFTVWFDDGTVGSFLNSEVKNFELVPPSLLQEFEKVRRDVDQSAAELRKQMDDLMQRLQSLAEEAGVPVTAPNCSAYLRYVPSSMKTKFNLLPDDIDRVLGYGFDSSCYGCWLSSSDEC